ncbi:hypothetical protein SDC9_57118 [bioreactor metagenome]|uniref:Uncharacterized protein n=1 Tax=bioreactor metagenome TaxID=1076179 RepID=A0A644X944_9ZZZZ
MKGNHFSYGAGRLALNALFTALAYITLFLSAVLPSGRIGFAAAAGLFPAAAIISGGGLPAGCLCYAAIGILALLLIPSKDSAVLFLLFFGLYPLLKCLVERIKTRPVAWACKLLICNAALFVFWFLFRSAFLSQLPSEFELPWIFFLAGNIAFVFYDVGFSGLISFYVRRIHNAVFR